MASSSFWQSYHSLPFYFDTIMILLSCLNNCNHQTHLNFRSKRWLEVQFDNYIIHCQVTRGLSPFLHHFDHPFFAGKVWRNPTNKLIIIFVLRDGLKFFWTIVLIYLLREAAAYLSHNLSVRELQLWSKGLVWRHPSTKASYCDTFNVSKLKLFGGPNATLIKTAHRRTYIQLLCFCLTEEVTYI